MKKLTWDISTRTQIISLGPALLLTLLLISFFTFVRIQDLRQELNHTGQLIANQLAPGVDLYAPQPLVTWQDLGLHTCRSPEELADISTQRSKR